MTTHNFTATQWDSAEQKEKFYRQFIKFVQSGFAKTSFPKWFYNRLSMTFGHIAHYNQGGFYETFFSDTAGHVQFIEQTLNYPCYGDPTFTYSDVERALQTWVRQDGTEYRLRLAHATAVQTQERTYYAALKAKYNDES